MVPKERHASRPDEASEDPDDRFSPEETERRRDDALRRALSMPPQRLKRDERSSDRVQKDTDRPQKQAKLPSR
jgi:hypothetical protein